MNRYILLIFLCITSCKQAQNNSKIDDSKNIHSINNQWNYVCRFNENDSILLRHSNDYLEIKFKESTLEYKLESSDINFYTFDIYNYNEKVGRMILNQSQNQSKDLFLNCGEIEIEKFCDEFIVFKKKGSREH